MTKRTVAREKSAGEELLRLYRRPASAIDLVKEKWPGILGAARRSRTLGHVGLALRTRFSEVSVDPQVRAHFDSASRIIAHRRRMLRWELLELGNALQGEEVCVLLLKGAAYEVNALPLAGGRAVNDLDILVARDELSGIERTLSACGWKAKALNEYDERYYRDWSHELPPFVHPDRGMELDVHHSITPAMRGGGVDTAKLIEKSIVVEWDGHRRFRVPQPVDQLIHCAIHTFKDSDLSLRLRETMDFDCLWRHYAATEPVDFSRTLIRRAIELGQERPLWWAMHFARRWLGSPIPEDALTMLPAPGARTIALMEWLCDRAMLPGRRMERTGLDRLAAIVLLARFQYQRLPLSKLVPHVVEKSRRRLLQPKDEPDAP